MLLSKHLTSCEEKLAPGQQREQENAMTPACSNASDNHRIKHNVIVNCETLVPLSYVS
jgi:hypothetical protein